MIPILTAEQSRATDAATMEREGIRSLDLMERAAMNCAKRIIHIYQNTWAGRTVETSLVVVSGMGNNGGDGAVIARALFAAGIPVRVIRIRYGQEASPDNEVNHQRLRELPVEWIDLNETGEFAIAPNEAIIDALFGVGLNRPLSGWVAGVVKQMNSSGRPIIAIDMPSGLMSEDNSGNDRSSIITAAITFSIETPKLAQLFPENAPYVGRLELVPIGSDQEFMQELRPVHYLVQENDVIELLPPRPTHGHKGTFGHALLIAGSTGTAGAAVFALQAAARSGAGLVTAHVPQAILSVIQSSVPEARCSVNLEKTLSKLPALDPFSAIGIGPGIGTEANTAHVIKTLIQSSSSNLVMDADALNILAGNPTWLSFQPRGTILTPHPKEFDRLIGSPSSSDHDRLAKARELAMKLGCILVLKNARTAICEPGGKIFFNPTGNAGMAKGGSGDALTGLLTGLLAQSLAPLRAAILGVYLHGLAGDIAAEHKGMDGMTVSDLIAALPEAWKRLRNASEEILNGAFSFPKDLGRTL